MSVRPSLAIIAGAIVSGAIAAAGARLSDEGFVERLAEKAEAAIADAGGRGVTADFTNGMGSPTRHPLLSGGQNLDEGTRDKVAKSVYRGFGFSGYQLDPRLGGALFWEKRL